MGTKDISVQGGRGSAKTFSTLQTTQLLLENEELKDKIQKLEKENKLLFQYAAYCYYGYDRPTRLILNIGKLLEKQGNDIRIKSKHNK